VLFEHPLNRLEEKEKQIADLNFSQATQRLAEVEQKTRTRPLKDRLREFLEKTDKNILASLKTNAPKFS